MILAGSSATGTGDASSFYIHKQAHTYAIYGLFHFDYLLSAHRHVRSLFRKGGADARQRVGYLGGVSVQVISAPGRDTLRDRPIAPLQGDKRLATP